MRPADGPTVHGLLLAAGAGRRMGGPKALLRDADGTSWMLRALDSLQQCDGATVVLGASAAEAALLLPDTVDRVVAPDWETGMGASLRAGLAAVGDTGAVAALVTLVDLPDVSAEVVTRVLQAVAPTPDTLARASYDGRPGHPVLLGRDHWPAAAKAAVGDRGARDLLMGDEVVLVECGDLATGRDIDEPD